MVIWLRPQSYVFPFFLCISNLHFRDFIETHYVPLKQNNPRFPILIRECSGVQPKVFARYGKVALMNIETGDDKT